MQPGDVLSTFVNVDDSARDMDFRPRHQLRRECIGSSLVIGNIIAQPGLIIATDDRR